VDLDNDCAYVIGKGSRPRTLPFGHQTSPAVGRYLRARARDK
jgi:site-specific recombinase XerC